ncbi:MAG: NADH-quinone oxidoreductase subunit K [Acidimicrobiales bacterium]
MIVTLAVTVGVLYAVGTYLLLQRTLTRIVLGLGLLTHGANLLLLAAGGRSGRAPLVGGGDGAVSDPLPQALALTAIVIAFGVSALLLTLGYRSWQLRHDDDVEDDVEDRRIARAAELGDDIVTVEGDIVTVEGDEL